MAHREKLARTAGPFCLLLLALVAAACTERAGSSPGPRASAAPTKKLLRLAITVDDLPGQGPRLEQTTRTEVVQTIVQTLKAHRVPSATGFVNGIMLEGDPDFREALAVWLKAGFEVGNHTYSHGSLDQLGVAGFVQDIERGDTVVDPLRKQHHQRARYFRFPFLEQGRTRAERKQLHAYLGAHGYVIAGVSIDFADWAWGEPFARCSRAGDTRALEVLRDAYLGFARASLEWAREAAPVVYGRDIPQVLLLHANVATANYLDALLSAYEQNGIRFIPLAEALADPVYFADYDEAEAHGATVVVEAISAWKRPYPPLLTSPVPLLDLVCR